MDASDILATQVDEKYYSENTTWKFASEYLLDETILGMEQIKESYHRDPREWFLILDVVMTRTADDNSAI
jgi:hypothetical protein